MATATATAPGGAFGMAVAAGAGVDDGDRRFPRGPMGKVSRSAHEEDDAAGDGGFELLPLPDPSYSCAACRLTFRDIEDLMDHLSGRRFPPLVAAEMYLFLVLRGPGWDGTIYVIDDGLASWPPETLRGRVVHIRAIVSDQNRKAARRYYPGRFGGPN